jgi:hypothetical protein
MSAADERVAELLQRWLASLELHAHYLDLDDDAYARVQDWPRHQRPTRWVVDLARSRVTELQRQLADRRSRGDSDFATALELMSFLTTLLASEHIERFIPHAVPRPAAPPPAAAVPESTRTTPAAAVPAAAAPPPRTEPEQKAPPASPAPSPRRKSPPRPKQPTAARATARRPAEPVAPAFPEQTVATVVADAVRFLSWGREWPQLASSIARLADRPPESEVWKILRQHRSTIEARANHKSG